MMKWIDGYEGLYGVTPSGQVYSFHKTPDGRILKSTKSNRGYLMVCLRKDRDKKYRTVHRLVAKAFLPIHAGARREVNHKDGNKINNAVDNLEWVTRREQMKHAFILGLAIPAWLK